METHGHHKHQKVCHKTKERIESKMTDTVSLSVKWGKETIALDFIVAGGVKGLKTELEEKTRVPADRMKLMAKSKGGFVSCWLCLQLFLFRSCSLGFGRNFTAIAGLWKGVLKDDFDFGSIDLEKALSKANGGRMLRTPMGEL